MAKLRKSAWVFAGGEFHVNDLDVSFVNKHDTIIGVDRGIEHCLSTGLVPDVLMGDFDSVGSTVLHDTRLADKQIIRHPVRKNSSDLDLALQWLSDSDIDRVVLLGISGGRSDHHLFNWLLPMQKIWPFTTELVDKSVHAYTVNAKYPLQIQVQTGDTVSVLPMPEADGVATEGLEYALHNAFIGAGTTLGLSNIAIAETVSVSIVNGQLLVFHVKGENNGQTDRPSQ